MSAEKVFIFRRLYLLYRGVLADLTSGWNLILLTNAKVAEFDRDITFHGLPVQAKVRMAKVWVTVYQMTIEVGYLNGERPSQELRGRATRIADNTVRQITCLFPE
jgi:hypothetical protein